MIYPNCRLIQFARYPEIGKVKTRLTDVLSEDETVRLHTQLVRYINTILHDSGLAPIDFWFNHDKSPKKIDPFFNSLNAINFISQPEGDLGLKMFSAFENVLKPSSKVEFAVLVGSDCPFIDTVILSNAMEVLSQGTDVVLGPAEDGGYYLIGLRKVSMDLFQNIPWGTSQVLKETLLSIKNKALNYHLLPVLADIDVAHDLEKLDSIRHFDWLKNIKS